MFLFFHRKSDTADFLLEKKKKKAMKRIIMLDMTKHQSPCKTSSKYNDIRKQSVNKQVVDVIGTASLQPYKSNPHKSLEKQVVDVIGRGSYYFSSFKTIKLAKFKTKTNLFLGGWFIIGLKFLKTDLIESFRYFSFTKSLKIDLTYIYFNFYYIFFIKL